MPTHTVLLAITAGFIYGSRKAPTLGSCVTASWLVISTVCCALRAWDVL